MTLISSPAFKNNLRLRLAISLLQFALSVETKSTGFIGQPGMLSGTKGWELRRSPSISKKVSERNRAVKYLHISQLSNRRPLESPQELGTNWTQ